MQASVPYARGRVAVAGVLLLTGLSAQPADAAGTAYEHLGFVHQLRAAALEGRAAMEWNRQNPNPVVVASGYSAVDLEKDPSVDHGDCEAVGAGTHLDLRGGLLENNGPPDAGNKGSNVVNPTEARDRSPQIQPGEGWGRRPGFRRHIDEIGDRARDLGDAPKSHGPWSARCDDDTAGRAAGHHVDPVRAGAAGSATTGTIEKATGTYVGTSRAFAAGLRTPAGVVELVSSAVRIKQRPGREALVCYRIAVNGGVLATGTDVPAGELTRQFGEQVLRNAVAVAALPALGLTLTGPTYGAYATRRIVHFPFLEVAADRDAGDRTRAVRVVTVAYESEPGSPARR